MILYETDTSVFELLWDIALTIFIFRIAFVYFILTYLSSLWVTFIRSSRLAPYNHITAPAAELVGLPFQIITIALWARAVIVFYEIPRRGAFRAAIGILGGAFIVVTELVTGILLWKEGQREWIWDTNLFGAILGLTSLAIFMAMPSLLMMLEKIKIQREEASHGHDQNSIVAALPTINRADKVERNGKKTM